MKLARVADGLVRRNPLELCVNLQILRPFNDADSMINIVIGRENLYKINECTSASEDVRRHWFDRCFAAREISLGRSLVGRWNFAPPSSGVRNYINDSWSLNESHAGGLLMFDRLAVELRAVHIVRTYGCGWIRAVSRSDVVRRHASIRMHGTCSRSLSLAFE